MKYLIQFIIVTQFIVIFFISIQSLSGCSQSENKKSNQSVKSVESTTISGIVETIIYGKDGYVSLIKTKNSDTYSALVSIVNLGGPENYAQFKTGDRVTVKGIASTLGDEKYLKVEQIIQVESSRTELVISETAFRGISVGDSIATHSAYTQKELLKTGEGNFEIYRIKDFNNKPAGYFLADPNNKNLVGDITVETQMAKTAEGIKVGSTFAELRKQLPEVGVHGSEIEGRTYAFYNSISYRLNVGYFTYEVDIEKIPQNAKIVEIVINRI